MNYEEYLMGNVTTAQIQNKKEDWSDYFTKQRNSIPLDKAYAEGKNVRTAASYMDMAAQVIVRPSHEAMVQMQAQKMAQQSIESRLAEQQRMYNEEYMRRTAGPVANPKKTEKENLAKAEPKPVQVPEQKAEEPIKEPKVLEAPSSDVKEQIEEPVIEQEPKQELDALLKDVEIQEPDVPEDEEDIPGVEFVPGGIVFEDEESDHGQEGPIEDEEPAPVQEGPIIDDVDEDDFIAKDESMEFPTSEVTEDEISEQELKETEDETPELSSISVSDFESEEAVAEEVQETVEEESKKKAPAKTKKTTAKKTTTKKTTKSKNSTSKKK